MIRKLLLSFALFVSAAAGFAQTTTITALNTKGSDGNKIGAGTITFRATDLLGNLRIAAGLPEGNTEQGFPHFFLEIGSGKIELQRKFLQLNCKIILQLLFRFAQYRMVFVFGKRA